MTEYKPKFRRKGINPPFGYFVSPIDPSVLLPDPKKIEALEYAFRMKAKYKTSIRDCCVWLHGQTAIRMTASGFMYAYKRWAGKIRKANSQKIAARKREITKEREALIQENFKEFTITTDDGPAIQPLAYEQARKESSKT